MHLLVLIKTLAEEWILNWKFIFVTILIYSVHCSVIRKEKF